MVWGISRASYCPCLTGRGAQVGRADLVAFFSVWAASAGGNYVIITIVIIR